MTDSGADPLHRFPLFQTSSPDELRHLASTLLGTTGIDFGKTDKFDARINLLRLPETSLAFGATSGSLTGRFLGSDFVRLHMALKGGATTSVGGRMTDITQRQLVVSPSDAPTLLACEAGHERLTLRMTQTALLQKLTLLLGVKPKGELVFDPAIAADQAYAQGLSQLVRFLAQQLDATPSRLPAAACRELEQAVQIAFLWASRHSFSHLLERREKEIAPSIVLRLEQFIEANWQDAITIDRLVAEAGVSARSIFRAFDRSRGYSPMAFAKSVRLRRAREVLMSGDPGVSVTAAAFRCNFVSPGHFARDYRDAFGELPSETISRTRR